MTGRWLAPLAAAACVAGCGRAAGPSIHVDQRPAIAPATTTQELTRAGAAARAYALAARSWNAGTYVGQYRKQVELSAGALRTDLRHAPPSRTQLAAYRRERASVQATVAAVTRRSERARRAQYIVVLIERSRASGQVASERTVNLVDLERRGGGWKVVRFTAVP